MDRIAKGLEADGILTGAGKTKWWTSTINKILRNEKYIGDALLQKTYTIDFLNKTRVKNNDIVPQYYVEGNHEAIIPKDIFLRVQEELVRRRVVKTSANGKKRSYSCNHCFAQIVICGECGEMFRRIHWNNRGCKSIVWRCISRLEPTGQEYHARTVNEMVLENVVVQAINTLLGDKSTYQAQLQQNIAKVIRSVQQNTADGIDERLQGGFRFVDIVRVIFIELGGFVGQFVVLMALLTVFHPQQAQGDAVLLHLTVHPLVVRHLVDRR